MALADLNPLHPHPVKSEVERSLRERLELFQVFTQVYSHHRDWLRRLVNLDKDAIAALSPASMHYIQGIVSPEGAYLVSNLATGHSQTVLASQAGWTLGRDPRQSNLAVLDRQLSRCHARLDYVAGTGFVLSDLDSTNGTFINGAALDSPQDLRDGDQIRLGNLTVFFFTCTADDAPQLPTAAVHDTMDSNASSCGEPSGNTTIPGVS